MNKKGLVLEIVFVLILLVVGFFWFVNQSNFIEKNEKRLCIPNSCCHASECIWSNKLLDCSEIDCTMNCEPGTMDCGQGQCEIIDDNCEVVWNE